jgi:hypothetical protein
MLLFMIVAAVLIGLAYADYCLVDNTEHFGICFGKALQAQQARVALHEAERLEAEGEARVTRAHDDVEVAAVADMVAAAGLAAEASEASGRPEPEERKSGRRGGRSRSPRSRPPVAPVPAWLLLELEPVLELREESP